MWNNEQIISLIIFLIAYIFIVNEKINRSVIAMFGGLLVIVLGYLPWDIALTKAIDWNTLFLLIGMMIIVGIAGESGMFEYFGIKVAKLCKGHPLRIVLGLGILTCFASMLLDNVTTILLLAPVTVSITRILKISLFPFMVTQVFLSNIGGTATIVGDPPNIMISQQVGLGFFEFASIMFPLVIIVTIAVTLILRIIYKYQYYTYDKNAQEIIRNLNPKDYIKNKVLMNKAIAILSLTILGFLLSEVFHFHIATIAMLGAFAMLLVYGDQSEATIEKAYQKIDWISIFFFMGLFMLTGALEHVGIIKMLANWILSLTQGDLNQTFSTVLWVSAGFSGFFDNIPFVSTMIPVIEQITPQYGDKADLLWYALAAGACFGGNLTIIGASANVVAVGIARKEGTPIPYIKFMKRGAIITLVSILITHIYLYLVFLL